MSDVIVPAPHKAALRRLLTASQEVIGGFLWLGNNLHNIKDDPDRFRELYVAALQDARSIYDRLDKLLSEEEPAKQSIHRQRGFSPMVDGIDYDSSEQ